MSYDSVGFTMFIYTDTNKHAKLNSLLTEYYWSDSEPSDKSYL